MADAQTDALLEMIETIQTEFADDDEAREMRRLVFAVARRRNVKAIVRMEQVERARELFALGDPRAIVCKRLQAEEGISESTADRIINEALSIPPKVARFWGKDREE